MRPRLSVAKLLFASNLVLIAALVAVAAPQLPTKSKLPFAVRSLAGLDRVEVRVGQWKQVPAEVDLNAAIIKAAWEERLVAAGFELDQGHDVPMLDLRVIVLTNPKVPNALTLRALLTLKQHVHVKRIDKELWLPTWSGLYIDLTPKSEIGVEIQGMSDQLIEEFIYRTELASWHQE